jgi:glutaredoxin
MKINWKELIFWILLAIVVFMVMSVGISSYTQQSVDKGSIIVYGSKTCPWCIKQEDYFKDKGIPYEFIDCRDGECPDFVQGFPTLVVNGQVKSGYTEL